MTVSELIAHLQTFPADMRVAYKCYSEQTVLDAFEVKEYVGVKARPDGWIQDHRKDLPTETYCMFPGN